MKAITNLLVLFFFIEVCLCASVLPQNQQLIEAATNGNTKKVKNILQISQINTVDIDTSLIKAAENGHNQIVDILLQNKANVDATEDDSTL